MNSEEFKKRKKGEKKKGERRKEKKKEESYRTNPHSCSIASKR
jgi:hypothetical protein